MGAESGSDGRRGEDGARRPLGARLYSAFMAGYVVVVVVMVVDRTCFDGAGTVWLGAWWRTQRAVWAERRRLLRETRRQRNQVLFEAEMITRDATEETGQQ